MLPKFIVSNWPFLLFLSTEDISCLACSAERATEARNSRHNEIKNWNRFFSIQKTFFYEIMDFNCDAKSGMFHSLLDENNLKMLIYPGL